MRLLLDSHTFLWFINNDTQLSSSVKNLIEDANNDILLSMASVWEMAIKVGLGKLNMPSPFEKFIAEQAAVNNFTFLNIALNHIGTMVPLPLHHRDPFDRLLIAQALAENIPILSRDAVFDAYGVKRLW